MKSLLTYVAVTLLTVAPFVHAASADTTQSDHVSLPAEFFFGRWAPGTSLDLLGRWQEGAGPAWYGSLAETRGDLRLELLGGIANSPEVNLDSRDESAGLALLWRPMPRWQVDIGPALAGKSVGTEFGYVGEPRSAEAFERKTSGISLVSQWSRRDTLRLTIDMARYAYLVGPVVGAGNVFWSARVDYVHGLREQDWVDVVSEYDPSGSSVLWRYLGHDSLWTDDWRLSSDLLWGLTNSVNLGLHTGVRLDNSVLHRYDRPRPGGFIGFGDVEQEATRPAYALAAVIHPDTNLFLSLSMNQQFLRASESESYYGFNDTTSFEGTLDFHVAHTDVRFQGDFITGGEFRPQVLLDDYAGFYHRMLAARQVHFRFGFEYLKAGTHYDGEESKAATLYAAPAVGLANGMQVGVELRYHNRDYPSEARQNHYFADSVLLDNSLTLALMFRWRSYEYVPGRGPGWENDGQMDIAFGPIPAAWERYISFRYAFTKSNYASAYYLWEYFGSTGVTDERAHSFTAYAAGGLGKATMVALGVKIETSAVTDEWDLSLRLTKRLSHAIQLSAEIAGAQTDRQWNDPELTLRVAGLF
ncbi:hypothetical protein KQH82_01735 [bacterium]|nr:hypothetical protein [bacterium]